MRMRPPINPLRALIDYLLGEDTQDVPPAPGELSAELAQAVALHLRRLVEFQNTDYALLYLDRLGRFRSRLGGDAGLFREIADLLATRMAFNDPIRIAQIVCGQAVEAAPIALPDGLYRPGVQEIAAMLPLAQARKVSNGLRRAKLLMGRLRIRPETLGGRLKLRLMLKMRRLRPMSLRYATEHAAIERWLHMIDRALTKRPEAVPEIVRSVAIVKGWGANYRLALLNWHVMIDRLAKPDFDGRILVPNLPLYLAEARQSLDVDPSGETLRALVANALTTAVAGARST